MINLLKLWIKNEIMILKGRELMFKHTIQELILNVEATTENLLKNNLGDYSVPVDIDALADKLGLSVYYEKMDTDQAGAILIESDKCGIIINEKDAPVRQRFTLAHEIGHFVSYKLQDKTGSVIEYRDGASSLGKNLEEVFANKFAAAILMPKIKLYEVKKIINDCDELSEWFNVSSESMKYRLSNI